MASPIDLKELTLVVFAVSCKVVGCCEWDEKGSRRFRSDPPLPGLTPEGVKAELIEYVSNGGKVVQVTETRPEYNDRPFYYKVILPFDGLPHGLFIEIVVDDDDPELPAVRIVHCHAQN